MWEYLVKADSLPFETSEQVQNELAEATAKLNLNGAQGWELTAVQMIPIANKKVVFVQFFKRPKKVTNL